MNTLPGCTALLSSFLVLSACGGGGSVELSDLAAETGAVTCAQLFDCCTAEELMAELDFGNIETEEQCVDFYASFIGGLLTPRLQASVDSGRMVYDAEAAGACFDIMGSMSCSEFGASWADDADLPPGCSDFFLGQQADGQPCAGDEECQNDYCVGDTMDFEGNTTEGVCGSKPGLGDDCSDDYECAEGYCAADQGAWICKSRQEAGAACNSDEECVSDQCAGGDPQNGTPGTCASEPVCNGV